MGPLESGILTVEAPVAELDSTQADDRGMPLCVDLDGTLVLTDTLQESLLAALKRGLNPLRMVRWLFRGRAYLKSQLAEYGPIDPETLPYNEPLLRYLRSEQDRGRRVVLVTAADYRVAWAVAAHLGLFDDVVASDGRVNLKGSAKAAVLVDMFGEGRFSYAGDSRQDLAVWAQAGAAIPVRASHRVASSASSLTAIEKTIVGGTSTIQALLRALRPHQWTKNLLVFVPIVTAGAMADSLAWMKAFVFFAALCATASAIYVFNDLADIAADRRHPRKRHRPLADGSLPIAAGMLVFPGLLGAGLMLGAMVGAWHIIALYAVCAVSYSVALKKFALVDVFALASLYSLRLMGGGDVSGYSLSMWLLAFSSFLFLSLAIVKRVGELREMKNDDDAVQTRRGYVPGDLPIMMAIGVAAAFSSSILLALYVQSRVLSLAYPGLMWAIVPLILFWQCRLWLATGRGRMNDDPLVYAGRDWVSWTTALCVAIIFAVSV